MKNAVDAGFASSPRAARSKVKVVESDEWRDHWEKLAKRAKQERENEDKKQKQRMASRTEKLAKRAKQKRDAKLMAEREAEQAEKTKDEALREVARLKKVLKVQRRDMAMKESRDRRWHELQDQHHRNWDGRFVKGESFGA